MKISKIHINAFGKLKNFTLEFDDGFNVIFGENEDGKTTVMTFIKCMFYGTGNKKQSLKESIREKYTPWDGSAMGGRIYFECGGVDYCLEREFKGSDSSDRITLTDKDSGKVLPADSRVGEKLFMLTEAAFVRSIFIDNAVSFTSDAGALADFNNRLSGTAVSSDESASQQKVLKRLNDAKNKVLSPTGRAGTLLKDREALAALKNRAERSLIQEKEMSDISERIEKETADISELEAEHEKEKKIIESESDVINARRLLEYAELREKIDALNETLKCPDGALLKNDFINITSMWTAKYEKHTARAEELSNQAKAAKAALEESKKISPEKAQSQLEELNRKTAELEEKIKELDVKLKEKESLSAKIEDDEKDKKNAARKFNPLLFAAGFIFAAVAAVIEIAFTVPYIAVAAAAFAVICFVLSLVFKPKAKTDDLSFQKEKVKEEIGLLTARKAEAASALTLCESNKTQIQSVIEAQNTLSKQREREIEQLEAEADAQTKSAAVTLDDLIKHFSKWKSVGSIEEIKEEHGKLEEIFEKRKEYLLTLNVYVKDFGDITAEQARRRLDGISADSTALTKEDFAKRKARLELLQKTITDKKAEKARLETLLTTGYAGFVNPQTILREINELNETVRAKEEFIAAAKTAIDVLNESAAGMRKSYGAALEDKSLKIFEGITGGKYGMLTVDDTLKMSAEEKNVFGTKSTDYLSRGTEDQAYLSLRLAISSLLSGEERLPIMLDDSLSQFDDKRLKAAVNFLREYAKNNQTVLFTCHGYARDCAEQSGVKVINAFEN